MTQAEYPLLMPQELAAAGQALFGDDWCASMARALGVTEAEVERVADGRIEAPDAWRPRLVALSQDMALRALETASTLLWRVTQSVAPSEPAYSERRYV